MVPLLCLLLFHGPLLHPLGTEGRVLLLINFTAASGTTMTALVCRRHLHLHDILSAFAVLSFLSAVYIDSKVGFPKEEKEQQLLLSADWRIFSSSATDAQHHEHATRIWNVLDHGAIGDGIVDDTVALRSILQRAGENTQNHREQQVVWLPANHTFCSGPLNLTSYITLQVDGILLAIVPSQSWDKNTKCTTPLHDSFSWPLLPPLETYGNSRDGGPSVRTAHGRVRIYDYLQHQAFIYAAHAQRVTITGSGIIDGQGPYWWDIHQNGIIPSCRPGGPI